jgi:hypothetical protein
MDVDMDDDSDDYDRRRRAARQAEKYSTSTRNPTIPATTNRHGRGDRTPPDESGRAIINAIPERDQPRIKPGSDRDFWIPDAGIEREVITYEITRYLGQDALVRPGKNDVRVAFRRAVGWPKLTTAERTKWLFDHSLPSTNDCMCIHGQAQISCSDLKQ